MSEKEELKPCPFCGTFLLKTTVSGYPPIYSHEANADKQCFLDRRSFHDDFLWLWNTRPSESSKLGELKRWIVERRHKLRENFPNKASELTCILDKITQLEKESI